MATLTFSFDTGNVPISRIVDGMAVTYGYRANVPDPENQGQMMPNPQSKAAFAKEQIKRLITEAVQNAEVIAARQAAESGVTPIDIA